MADDRSVDLGPKKKFFNVILLGLSFMLVFTGFQTCGMVEQTVLRSYHQNHTNYKGDGYTSLAIIYAVFAAANWIAPSIVSVIGPKYSMIISAVTYTAYIATFIKPVTATLYVGSVLIGIGAAVLWTAQGNFLTLNSDDLTMGRNSGLFWAMMQCSLLFGNLYVYVAWRGVKDIEDEQRIPLYSVLTTVSGVGMLSMLAFRSHPKSNTVQANQQRRHSTDSSDSDSQQQIDDDDDAEVALINSKVEGGKASGAWEAFLKAIELFKTRQMILLSVTCFYTGLELTFFSGVYTTCVGGMLALGSDSDKLVGLTGIMIGVGEIIGGATFGIFGKSTVRKGRDPVIFLGLFLHLTAFFLIFLNVPDNAPLTKTYEIAYIQPSQVLAVGCGLLLGIADACFNTQIYSILGVMYPENSAPAFALFKFEQSLAAAIGFFYSNHLVLKWQLLIMVVFGVAGTLTFFKVESGLRRRQNEEARDSEEE